MSIDPDGEEEVYDLTVDGAAQLRRRGHDRPRSIEQDADLVAFVYRDEYYNGEESDSQGLAEMILAKHRNGPTDTIKLSFLKRYAKFTDMAAATSTDAALRRSSRWRALAQLPPRGTRPTSPSRIVVVFAGSASICHSS